MELHQVTSMCDCEYFCLLLNFFCFVVYYMIFDQKLQKLKASCIYVDPAFTFHTFVLANSFFLLVSLLFPCCQRFSLKYSSTLLTQNRSQSCWYFFQVFCHGFQICKCIDCPLQIRYIYMVKARLFFVKPYSYFLCLLFSNLGECSRLLSADDSLCVFFCLSVSGKQQSNNSFILLHFMTILKILIDMIDRVQQVNGKDIYIAQDLSLSHAGTVWDGAIVMIHYWNKHKHVAQALFKGKRVLEVGSGTGIVGIAAAAFNPKKVYLTDLPEYLAILQSNKNKNIALNQSQGCVQVCRLQWGNKQDISDITDIDTLIGSQLAYDKHHVIQLMQTIKHYKIENPKLKLMISFQNYKEQWKNLDIKFSQFFGKQAYSLVSWGQFDEQYRDEHIGILYFNNLLQGNIE